MWRRKKFNKIDTCSESQISELIYTICARLFYSAMKIVYNNEMGYLTRINDGQKSLISSTTGGGKLDLKMGQFLIEIDRESQRWRNYQGTLTLGRDSVQRASNLGYLMSYTNKRPVCWTSGATKFINIIPIILVTLCCAAYKTCFSAICDLKNK